MESIREGATVSFIILRLVWRTQLAPEVSRDSSAFPWPGHGPAAGQLDRNRQGLGLLGEDELRRRQRQADTGRLWQRTEEALILLPVEMRTGTPDAAGLIHISCPEKAEKRGRSRLQ